MGINRSQAAKTNAHSGALKKVGWYEPDAALELPDAALELPGAAPVVPVGLSDSLPQPATPMAAIGTRVRLLNNWRRDGEGAFSSFMLGPCRSLSALEC